MVVFSIVMLVFGDLKWLNIHSVAVVLTWLGGGSTCLFGMFTWPMFFCCIAMFHTLPGGIPKATTSPEKR